MNGAAKPIRLHREDRTVWGAPDHSEEPARSPPRAITPAPTAASPCQSCTVRDGNLCGAVLSRSAALVQSRWSAPAQDHAAAHARQNIYFCGEPSDDVYVICKGWAISFVQLPDGRRQVLAVLLPGDLFSVTSLFEPSLQFSVQALTEVVYCRYKRDDLQAKLATEADLRNVLARLTVFERRESDALLID